LLRSAFFLKKLAFRFGRPPLGVRRARWISDYRFNNLRRGDQKLLIERDDFEQLAV
jgi:hypothetical protein